MKKIYNSVGDIGESGETRSLHPVSSSKVGSMFEGKGHSDDRGLALLDLECAVGEGLGTGVTDIKAEDHATRVEKIWIAGIC